MIVEVAKGEGKGVGFVVLREGGEMEEVLNHVLHLLFLRAARTGDGLFDAAGFVFVNGQSRTRALGDHRAARLAKDEGGLEVFGEEDGFDGGGNGLVFGDDGFELALDVEEAGGTREVGRVADAAGIKGNVAVAKEFDNGNAGGTKGGVNAEDFHKSVNS